MPLPSPGVASTERPPGWPAFSTDEMLDVIRDGYRPRWKKAIVECEGKAFRTLVSPAGRPLNGLWQFPLFLEPVEASTRPTPVPYLDSVCLKTTAAGETLPAPFSPAPFIDWSAVPGTWDEYLQRREHAAGTDGFATLRRKERALARDHGDVEVCFNDRDPAVFDVLTAWKSAQYRRTGLVDLFASPRNRAFYREMASRGLLELASLRAGGRLVAAHAGSRIGGRFLYRLPAFDLAAGRYSPGALLTYHLVRRSFESGDREFDFLLGGEAYKFTYATHVRWVGPLGNEPLSWRTARTARSLAGRAARGTWWRQGLAAATARLRTRHLRGRR